MQERAHPDLNQGPADLQSAALTTELCTHALCCTAVGFHVLAYLSFVECNRKTEGPRSKPACSHLFPVPAQKNGSGTSAHANASLPDLINLPSLCDLFLGVMEARSGMRLP